MRHVHVETIGERKYLCSDSHEDRPGPGHMPVCDVTGIDARILQNACTAMNYAIQQRDGKSLGQIAFEIWISLGAVTGCEWAEQDQERWESFAEMLAVYVKPGE